MKPNPLHPTALIVSRSTTTSLLLRNLLRLSFQLIERSDSLEAEETLRANSVDLVIFDSDNLSDDQIFSTASRFRALLKKKKTPLLLITNNLKKKFAQDALRAGVTDFINQPLDEDEIEQRIAVAFQSFEQAKNVAAVANRSKPSLSPAAASLSNRQFLNDQAIKTLAHARQEGISVSLLIVEIDSKKSTPTTEESHLLFVSLLKDLLRKNDILIPQSISKVMIVLPKTSERAAELIAESIRLEVEQKIFPLSVSIGLISWDPTHPAVGTVGEEFTRLIEVATQAVHEAKKTGNRIITSDPL